MVSPVPRCGRKGDSADYPGKENQTPGTDLSKYFLSLDSGPGFIVQSAASSQETPQIWGLWPKPADLA